MLGYLTNKIQVVHALLADPAYHIAARYFAFNSALVLLALVIGMGTLAVLLQHTRRTNVALLPGTAALLAISTGLAIMLAELFVCAVLQVMTPALTALLYAITAVLALGLCWRERYLLGSLVQGSRITFSGVVTLAFIGVIAISQLAIIEIPGGYDSTAFHVPYADVFVKQHGLAVDEHLIYPYHTFNINLFFSLALMIEHNIIYVQTVHSLFAALSVFGIYMFCREAGQRQWLAIAAALCFSKLYIVSASRIMANVDLGSMYFVLLAVFALYLWSGKREATWLLICSAIAFGVAMGSKYIIVVIALPMAMYIALHAGKQLWRPLLIYIAWAAAFGLWWYIRNWIYTGNPVHPFATGIFGYYLWDVSDMAGQMVALDQVYLPRDVKLAPLFPFYAYHNSVLRFQDTYLVIWMLYAATWLCWLFSWPGTKRINALLLFCWIYFVSWLFGSQDPRHLMPVIPLVVVHLSAVLDRLCTSAIKLFGAKYAASFASQRFGKVVVMLLALLMLAYGLRDARGKFLMLHGKPLQSGSVQEVALRKNMAVDLFYAANEVFSENDTVLDMGMRDGRWFFKGHVVGNQFGPHGYERVMNRVARPETEGISPALLEQLLRKEYFAQGFIIPNESMPYLHGEFDIHFQLIYRNSLGSVYRLRNP